ncbi:hypothetical protein C0J52_04721 [Blattella germanica]|nr:hypothetical protein C0J52_04721 [Blattella germanica]
MENPVFSCIDAYFIHQCSQSDPNVERCLTEAANHLARCFRREPVYLDEIAIALGSGPDGYRATFRDIEAFGLSNTTILGVRTDLDTLQFQISFYFPRITARAHYRSSGVLIMVKASGGGDYWGEYGEYGSRERNFGTDSRESSGSRLTELCRLICKSVF